jgi:hypothetical protein
MTAAEPDFIDGAAPRLREGLEPGDRIVGVALTVRREDGELRTMAVIPGEQDMRCIVFTDEEDVDDALVRSTVNMASGDVSGDVTE